MASVLNCSSQLVFGEILQAWGLTFVSPKIVSRVSSVVTWWPKVQSLEVMSQPMSNNYFSFKQTYNFFPHLVEIPRILEFFRCYAAPIKSIVHYPVAREDVLVKHLLTFLVNKTHSSKGSTFLAFIIYHYNHLTVDSDDLIHFQIE